MRIDIVIIVLLVLGLIHVYCYGFIVLVHSCNLIIIHQISQIMDHYMPILGEYRRNTDLKYTQPLRRLIAKSNTTKP
jgi:hypothetical protein